MRPRSAPAAAAATAAAHRSAGKRQGCQGPVVRACKGVGDRPFSLCEERIGAVSHGKRRSKNPPRQALPGLVRQVAPQGSGEKKEESGPGRETLSGWQARDDACLQALGEWRGGRGRRRPRLALQALADDLERRTLVGR